MKQILASYMHTYHKKFTQADSIGVTFMRTWTYTSADNITVELEFNPKQDNDKKMIKFFKLVEHLELSNKIHPER